MLDGTALNGMFDGDVFDGDGAPAAWDEQDDWRELHVRLRQYVKHRCSCEATELRMLALAARTELHRRFGEFVPQDDMLAGRWRGPLARLMAQPEPPVHPRTDGAEVGAQHALGFREDFIRAVDVRRFVTANLTAQPFHRVGALFAQFADVQGVNGSQVEFQNITIPSGSVPVGPYRSAGISSCLYWRGMATTLRSVCFG